jgi:hypothetical protein
MWLRSVEVSSEQNEDFIDFSTRPVLREKETR